MAPANQRPEASSPQKTDVPCPVCGGVSVRTLYEPWVDVSDPVKLYGAASGIQGTQTIAACETCAMIFETPRYPESVIIDGYVNSEESGHDSQHEMRVKSFYLALRRLRRHLPAPGAKVLDIGTAGGAFLEAATRFGYDSHGMEPSRYLVDRGKQRGLQIEQGTIDRHGFEPASFDMVSLWDVIEHLTEPRNALVEISKLLKPDGILLINYPDIGTWQAKLAGRRFWWILSVHLHYFTRRSVGDLCRRTGFEAFHFRRYWQVLEFGYLERMAVHYGIPLTGLITRLTPNFIQKIPLPYYASQTTALARLKS